MNGRRKQPRGIALILVVGVVALASVLGWVMLSSATLQTRAAANHGRLSSADYLAESGLNIALYYLQYPEKAPGYSTNFSGLGYWGGTGGDISLSSSVPGTVSVSVTQDPDDKWSYEITCTAKSGTNVDTMLTRTTGARVYVRNEYQVKHAGAFNGNTTVMPYMNFVGDVWSAKTFGLRLGSPTPTVSGVVYCKTLNSGVGWVTPSNGVAAIPSADNPAPSIGTNGLNKYPTYVIDDVTYSRDLLNVSSLASTTIDPTASNPAGVYYRDGSSGGDLQINDNVTINGTLIVEGNVQIRGANVVINAQNNFPGLVVTGNLEIFQSNKNLTVNGLCYIGGTLRSNGITPPLASISKFNVNGALLMGTTGSGSTMSGYNVLTTVTYISAKAKAPEMTANYRVPTGVSIVRWGLP
jgi:Tfp pilus assembly protein PilX